MIEKVLTIAGSDSSGGGGLQADLKTFEEYGVFGFSAITSIVTMQKKTWKPILTPLNTPLLTQQLETVYESAPLSAVKIGVQGSIENLKQTAFFLETFHQKNVVVDPVLAAKGTKTLLQKEVLKEMKETLLPLASVTTPNLIEAQLLTDIPSIQTIEDMKKAATRLYRYGVAHVVIKGGRRFKTTKNKEAIDLYYNGKDFELLKAPLYDTPYNHGAGCTFAAAITAGLAKHYSVNQAIHLAKAFVNEAVKESFPINSFVGHVWHGAYNHADKRMELKKEKVKK